MKPPRILEFTDARPQVEVPESEYLRLLGFPRRHQLEGRARELANWARHWYATHGRPWVLARPAMSVELGPGRLSIDGVEFSCQRLEQSFAAAHADQAVLVAASAGPECEQHARRCWEEEKPDEYFFLEILGSAVVECLVAQAAGRICAWADQHGLGVLPRSSPGYSGWPVAQQVKLWNLVRGNNGSPFPGRLEVLPSGMLRPKKSILAVLGVTAHPEKVLVGSNLVPCVHCSLLNCQYRRAPYRYRTPPLEDAYDETLRS